MLPAITLKCFLHPAAIGVQLNSLLQPPQYMIFYSFPRIITLS